MLALFNPWRWTAYTALIMGMFDEIRCDAPLPDGHDAAGVWFQSKSFPDCGLCRYVITRAGRLLDARNNDLEPEGYLTFYTSDPLPSDAGASERQSCWREYRARFVAGQLQGIERVSQGDRGDRYHGLASFRWFDTPGFLFGDPDDPDAANRTGDRDDP